MIEKFYLAIDGILTNITTLGESGPGSNVNEVKL